MNSNVRAVLVVWPGKAAVDSLVDRLSKGGKPKFYHFSSWKNFKIVKIVFPTIFKRKIIIKQTLVAAYTLNCLEKMTNQYLKNEFSIIIWLDQ